MVTFEQIKLLESKITRVIDVVTRLSEENTRIKKRNGELEELVEKLKSEKSRIEEGIISALDRLNQFEDTIERSLDSVRNAGPQNQNAGPPPQQNGSAQAAGSGRDGDSGPARQERPAQAEPARRQPVPQTYLIDEEAPEEENEDTGEAELDIF
jgi:chromosome segregation ATPase